eukprot:363494-Chlamydomonas_euryale.AAC.6
MAIMPVIVVAEGVHSHRHTSGWPRILLAGTPMHMCMDAHMLACCMYASKHRHTCTAPCMCSWYTCMDAHRQANVYTRQCQPLS